MPYLFTLFSLFGFIVLVCGEIDNESAKKECEPDCRGAAYQCIDGHCYCGTGYVPNPTLSRCVKCPGLGEKCFGVCCNRNGNATLTCWQGVCQPCFDNRDHWICRDSMDNILIVSSTQIAMATALFLGIIATFVLLYKLCAVTTVRPLGTITSERHLSIGSLQVYINERLRDAPPRYTRAPISGSAIIPASVYINAGFIHDSSVPPPPYTREKDEDNRNQHPIPTIHI